MFCCRADTFVLFKLGTRRLARPPTTLEFVKHLPFLILPKFLCHLLPLLLDARPYVCSHPCLCFTINLSSVFGGLAPLRNPRDSCHWHHLVPIPPFQVRCHSLFVLAYTDNIQLGTRKAQVPHPARKVLWVILRFP